MKSKKKIHRLKYCIASNPNEATTLTLNCENKSHTNNSECIQFFMQDRRQRQENIFPFKGEEEESAHQKRRKQMETVLCVLAKNKKMNEREILYEY